MTRFFDMSCFVGSNGNQETTENIMEQRRLVEDDLVHVVEHPTKKSLFQADCGL
jgi:hypothetical protein